MKVKARVTIARKTRCDPFLNNHAHSRRENPPQGGCGLSSGVETATNRRNRHSCRSGRHHLTMLLCHFRLFRLPRCGSPLWLMPIYASCRVSIIEATQRMASVMLLRRLWNFLWTVSQYRFVMRQNVALRLLIQHVDIVLCEVDDIYPVTGGVRYFRFCG